MTNAPRTTRSARFRRLLPGLLAMAVGLLGCSGGADLPAGDSTPPAPPTLTLPASATVGFPVDLAVRGPLGGLNYIWTLSGATFQGGKATATGSAVSFTPAAAGVVSLACEAIKGNILHSQPSQAQLTVTAASTAAGSFQPGGSLDQARQGLAATVLPNGTVLAMGGAASAGVH